MPPKLGRGARELPEASTRSLPDVYVLVMDSVGAAAAASIMSQGGGPAPGLKALTDGFVSYPRAATVAPWTVPSHLAILTGRYPWDATYATDSHWTEVEAPTIAGRLREVGYRSICLSSNAFLSPHFGLTRDFDSVVWGGPWEPFVRYRSSELPPIWNGPGPAGPGVEEEPRGSTHGTWAQLIPRVGMRFPRTLHLLNSLASHLTSGHGGPVSVSPWLEELFERQLASIPSDRPTYALLNTMDAHDPYLIPGPETSRRAYLRIPQDPLLYMTKRIPPTDPRVLALRSAYRGAVEAALARVAGLVEIIARVRGLDRAAIFVTADHGQSFMEDGVLFHGFSVHDSVIRVPFLVHWPTWLRPIRPNVDWVSLVDIAPTVHSLAGLRSNGERWSGMSLLQDSMSVRPDPVIAVSTGIHNRRAARLVLSDSLFRKLDQVRIAGYRRGCKATLEMETGRLVRESVVQGGPDTTPASEEQSESFQVIEDSLSQARRFYNPRVNGVSAETVQDRLATWGYV